MPSRVISTSGMIKKIYANEQPAEAGRLCASGLHRVRAPHRDRATLTLITFQRPMWNATNLTLRMQNKRFARLTNADFDYVFVETVGTGQEALPFRSGLIDQAMLVMNPDYGARLQLQKIVMLDVADIVVVNKTDLDRARVALSEIEHRLGQNKRDQQLVATVAKRHRDPGVDELYEMITVSSGGGKK